MDATKSTFYLLISFLLFLSSPTILLVRCQIRPIVEYDNGNITHMQAYIVHVQKPTNLRFLRFNDRINWYKSFLPNTTIDSGEPRMIYAYRHVISGFAAWLTDKEAEAMRSKTGILLAYPEEQCFLQTTYTPQFLGLNRWDGTWDNFEYGAGQIIAMLDTGVKPTHPSFRDADVPPPPEKWEGSCYWGEPICNNKLIGAVGFKHGRSVSPLDDKGHGTHTASTAGGNFVDDANVLGRARGTASGVAPKAHLAIYKVSHLQLNGELSAAAGVDILKGIEQAIRDHVDVVSMSIGMGTIALWESSIAIGSYAAITKRIIPVAAAGNNGPFKSMITNDAPWLLTVGASTTDRRIRAKVRLGNGEVFYGETAYQPEEFNSIQLPLVYPGVLQTQETLNCKAGSMDKFDVKGKIVMCGVGHITNVEKGKIVKAAGGVGMILMNQPWMGNTTYSEAHVIPTAHVSFNDAWKIITYFNSVKSGATGAISFEGEKFDVHPWPSVAYFSSRGPSLKNGNIIKPDVIAPGVNILAAWPFEVESEGHDLLVKSKTFNFSSGTSMATPHVAGIVAMLRNNHPDWSPAMVKSAIMTTAYAVDSDGNAIGDDSEPTSVAASVFAVGSGLVNPVAANDPGLVYDLQHYDYIHYLCGLGYTDRQVTAIAQGLVQCSKVHAIKPEQLNYPSISVSLSRNSPQVTVHRTVTNVGDADAEYMVQFYEPKGAHVDVEPSTLKFSQKDEKKSFQVTISMKGGAAAGKKDQVSEGQYAWVSGKYYVRSPIAVTFL